MALSELLQQKREEILRICAKYGAQNWTSSGMPPAVTPRRSGRTWNDCCNNWSSAGVNWQVKMSQGKRNEGLGYGR